MWSIGVMSHMLLTGSPVFRGSEDDVMAKIKKGQTQMSSRFCKLSPDAQDFVQALLEVRPDRRLSAQQAMDHPFVASKSSRETSIGLDIVQGLRKYAHASRFRRVCLSMMAWSLSQEDRQHLQDKFLEMDVQKEGKISLPQFKVVLEESFKVNSVEAETIFAALDTDHDNTICYSEFMAAVMQDRVRMHEDILRKTFSRFDQDESGMITVDNLRTVLGDTFEDVNVQELLDEADTNGKGSLCYEDFLQYLNCPETVSSLETKDDDVLHLVPATMSPAEWQRAKHYSLAGRLIDKLVPEEANAIDKMPLTPLSCKSSQPKNRTFIPL
jgi:Ca2+-binding EF-hand superfamily protein